LGLILLATGVASPRLFTAAQDIEPQTSTPASPSASPTRYHPTLVALHWVIAVLLLAPLVLGEFVLTRLSSTDPLMFHGLRAHMSVGILIGTLMVARFFIRISTRRPQAIVTGSASFAGAVRILQWLLYIAVLGQVVSGLLLAWQANLFAPILIGQGSLPTQLQIYPAFAAHFAFSRLLVTLIALHVLAAVYHRIVLRDDSLRRMSFSRRASSE
jgi:cytochrome b561